MVRFQENPSINFRGDGITTSKVLKKFKSLWQPYWSTNRNHFHLGAVRLYGEYCGSFIQIGPLISGKMR